MLQIGECSAENLATQYDTPLYVYDKNIILSRIQMLRTAFPFVSFCYAVKANANPELLQIIAKEGLGADCSNRIELGYALQAGFAMEKSIFTAVNPRDDDLKQALQSGIIMNLDARSIFHRVLRYGTPARISFRINPGFGRGKFPGIIVGGEGTKFGMDETEAMLAYADAKKAGVNIFGIHMMTGSCVLHEDYFKELTIALQEIAGRIEKKLGISFSFLDIGGGLGVPYEPYERPLDLSSLGKKIANIYKHQAQLMMEPGRFIVAEAGTLLTRVTTIKGKYIGIDAGMSTLLRPSLYGAYHPIVLARDPNAKIVQEAHICGPVCENTDFFAKNRPLPSIKEGDLLAIQVAGAYGYAMASSFNGLLRPAELLVEGKKHKCIRKREQS